MSSRLFKPIQLLWAPVLLDWTAHRFLSLIASRVWICIDSHGIQLALKNSFIWGRWVCSSGRLPLLALPGLTGSTLIGYEVPAHKNWANETEFKNVINRRHCTLNYYGLRSWPQRRVANHGENYFVMSLSPARTATGQLQCGCCSASYSVFMVIWAVSCAPVFG